MLTHHDGKMSVSSRWKDEKVMCIISILTHHDGKMSVSSRWKDEKLTPLLHLLHQKNSHYGGVRWQNEKLIKTRYGGARWQNE